MTQHCNRREWLAGATAAAVAVSGSSTAHSAEQESEPFRYGLNTSTIRGQNLGIVREVELAGQAGYDGIEPWIRELDEYVKQGGSLSDLRKRIADAGLTVTYEAISLAPNETRSFTLAGFIPYGAAPDRITFMLDPMTRPTPPPRLPGSNALVWRMDTNPYCSAAIADPPGGVLPPP